MSQASFNQLTRAQDRIHAGVEPFSAVQRAIAREQGIQDILEAATRTHQTLRPILGPVEDLRQVSLVGGIGQIAAGLEGFCALTDKIQKSYRLPEVTETIPRLQSPELQALWRTLDCSSAQLAALQRAIDSISTPWMDTANAVRSIAGICELHGIGRLLQDAGAFAPGPAGQLRSVLGDWRAPMDWPASIFTDPFARSEFYLERGLEPALTEYPAEAFSEIVTSAGLKRPFPNLVVDYSPDEPSDDSDEEAGFLRTNAAHDRLQRFETHMRRFIERKMQAAFGNAWIKRRVPSDIRSAWKRKKDSARGRGEPERPPIAYADFTDYEKIITRGDNWQEVFEPVFVRQTLVQESFQRLYPIRVCTMHARLITQDDELYLYVETKRILAAIGIDS